MPRSELPTVALIVLNYNGREHLERCLESLGRLDYPAEKLELILADNASTDGSVAFVGERFPGVKVLAFDTNHGFAGGNNRAARETKAEWVGFLNNDMHVEASWLREMVSPLARQPEIACLSGKILTWDGSAIDFIGAGVNFQGFGFPVDVGRTTSPDDRFRRLLAPCGGAMLIRRQVFEDLDGFDTDYFAFYEDTDLGWRLNLLGHDVYYVPDAVVYHRHHGSFKRVAAERRRALYERNALMTMYKCLDDAHLAAALPAALLLLNEKALALAGVERGRFFPDAVPKSAAGGRESGDGRADPAPEWLSDKAARVFRTQGALGVLRKGSRFAFARAASRARRLGNRILGSPVLPPEAVAHYAGMSEFAHRLPRLQEKRRRLQERRVRSDDELLDLFVHPLEPVYHDPEYVRVHWQLVKALGLDKSFTKGRAAIRPARTR